MTGTSTCPIKADKVRRNYPQWGFGVGWPHDQALIGSCGRPLFGSCGRPLLGMSGRQALSRSICSGLTTRHEPTRWATVGEGGGSAGTGCGLAGVTDPRWTQTAGRTTGRVNAQDEGVLPASCRGHRS
jgi:hypothetical protein